jgi:hypothetical protein
VTLLDDRFRVLTSGNRTALPRHQTLRAAIDWSYELLTKAEQTLLRRLSVFAGGGTLPAVEAVCAGGALAPADVVTALPRLVDHSLVLVDGSDGEPRYRLLETVRQYAADPCRAGEDAAVRDRHRDYFVALAEEGDGKLRGFEQAAWLTRLEREHDNVRVALAWCLGDERDDAAGLRLAGAMAWFWRLRHLSEGRRGRSGAKRTARTRAAGRASTARVQLCSVTSRRLASRGARARASRTISWHWPGRSTVWDWNAAGQHAALLDLSEPGRLPPNRTPAVLLLYFQPAWQGAELSGRQRSTMRPQRGAASGHVVRCFGLITTWEGSERAADLYRASLRLQDEIQALWGIAECVWRLAVIAQVGGRLERAARLFGAQQALFAKMGLTSDHPDLAERQRGMSVTRDALGEAAFAAAWADGQALTLDEVSQF